MFRAVILGAPASGKGTISSRIVKHFGVTHLSSGDMLRHVSQQNTELGLTARQLINDGQLVPDHLMLTLMLTHLQQFQDRHWLLDGFPRTRVQGEALQKKYKLNMAIALEVPVEEIIERVKGRWVHIPSGRVYNDTYNLPKVPRVDDVTGEPLVQRPDDRPDAVRRRLDLYSQTVRPLTQLYEETGLLVRVSGRTSDEIWPKVKKAVAKYF